MLTPAGTRPPNAAIQAGEATGSEAQPLTSRWSLKDPSQALGPPCPFNAQPSPQFCVPRWALTSTPGFCQDILQPSIAALLLSLPGLFFLQDFRSRGQVGEGSDGTGANGSPEPAPLPPTLSQPPSPTPHCKPAGSKQAVEGTVGQSRSEFHPLSDLRKQRSSLCSLYG